MNKRQNLSIRVKNKALRVAYQPSSWKRELAFLMGPFRPTPTPESTLSFVGSNWETSPELPMAVLWGYGEWKREYVSTFLPEYRTAFVNGRPSVESIHGEFPELWGKEGKVFFGWGRNLPKFVLGHAKVHKVPVFNIEDGFLRSFGPGDLHTKPHSLVVDDTGIYFDATRPSELETITNAIDFEETPELLLQAKAGLEIMRAAKLSKYYSLVDPDQPKALVMQDPDKSSILVMGQVENDASIRFGIARKSWFRKKFRNSDMVEDAVKNNPQSEIFFRPHPDTIRSKKKLRLTSEAQESVTTVKQDVPYYDAIAQVDHVYTQTSLSGLEAAIMGKQVTVLGLPFYGGWGISENEVSVHRRDKKNLETVFAAAYLKYPRYIHPSSDELCTFFDVASYFFIEKVKFSNIVDMKPGVLDLEKLRANEAYLAAPAQLLLYLTTTPYVGSGKVDKVMDIANRELKLADFAQFSQLLIQTSNYDALVSYVNAAVAKFNKNWDSVKYNKTLLDEFFRALSVAQKNSNGRILTSIADQSEKMAELVAMDIKYEAIAIAYVRVLSQNLEYDRIDNFLRALRYQDSLDLKPGVRYGLLSKICVILQARPTRSERNHAKRRKLLVEAADHYKALMVRLFPDRYDAFMNSVMQAIAMDDEKAVVESYALHLDMFKEDEFSFDNPKFQSWGKLSRRLPHFYSIYNYLLKKGRYDYVKNMLQTQFFTPEGSYGIHQKAVMENLWLSFHASQAGYRKYMQEYNMCSELTQQSPKAVMGYAKALKSHGEFQRARDILMQHKLSLKIPEKRAALETEIDKINFSIRTSQILSSYPQPKTPKGVIFLASQNCFNTMAMMTPSLVALKKKGYAVVNLMQGMLPHDPTGIDYIDQFSACLPATLYRHQISNNWEVDWQKRVVKAAGVNYYQGFYERLSTAHRVYAVDINQTAIQRDFMIQLKRSDVCLDICQRIYEDVVGRNINVVFVSGNSHVTPFSTYRDFCRGKDDPRLSFINCNVAYESYFSNLGSKFAHTMCVTDMTLHPDRRAPFLALKEDFDLWYKNNKTNAEFKERADNMIKVNRNSSTDDSVAQEWIKYLTAQRKAGKKVICCFGKVPVDLNVPYDGGPGHIDMADWITNTAEVCGKNEDIILLIKPHPHELKPEIALDLIDSFNELIDTKIMPNVKVMAHRDINVHALAPHLDLAVLWNGSSSLELTALGIPVMMVSHFGRHDYPVDLIYPKSRKQYASYLNAGKFRKPSAALRQKSAFLISYMGTPEISILNEYAQRQITNDKVGIPLWREEKIANFLENGDPKMDMVAGRILEKFEGKPPMPEA